MLRTTVGGQVWATFQIPSETGVAEVRDLFFLNESCGWLVTWHYNNDGTHLYVTTDGGRTWRMHPDRTIQGPGKWLSVVRFLNSKTGFAFSRDDQVDAVVEPPAVGVVAVAKAGPTHSGQLLYTDDGGEHWRPRPLDAWDLRLSSLGQELGCSASKTLPLRTVSEPGQKATERSEAIQWGSVSGEADGGGQNPHSAPQNGQKEPRYHPKGPSATSG